MTLVDWPHRHALRVIGAWRGLARIAGEWRGRVRLTQPLMLPPPTLRTLEAGRVVLLEWPDVLGDLLRALPLGPRGDLRDAALTVMHDGARSWTIRARGIEVAASTVPPPPRRASAPAPGRACIGCGPRLPPGTWASYCSGTCRETAHRRRRGVAAGVEPEAAHVGGPDS